MIVIYNFYKVTSYHFNHNSINNVYIYNENRKFINVYNQEYNLRPSTIYLASLNSFLPLLSSSSASLSIDGELE